MNFKLFIASIAALMLSACSGNYDKLDEARAALGVASKSAVRVSVYGKQLPQVADNVKSVDTGRLKVYIMDGDDPYRENLVEEVDMAYRVPVQAKPVRVAHVQKKRSPVQHAVMNSQQEAQRRIDNLRQLPAQRKPPTVVKPKTKVSAKVNTYQYSAASKVRELPSAHNARKLPAYDQANKAVGGDNIKQLQSARPAPVKISEAPQRQWQKPAYKPLSENKKVVVRYQIPRSSPENTEQKARRLRAELAVRELKESKDLYRKAQSDVSKTRKKRRRSKRIYNTMPNPGLKTKPKLKSLKRKMSTKKKGTKKLKGKWKWDENGEMIRS